MDEQNIEALGPSEEDIADYTAMFNMFDKDGDGNLTKEEFETATQCHGCNPTGADIEKAMNGKEALDLQQFISFMHQWRKTIDEEKEMREAFKMFDRNGDGFISVDELKTVLTELGDKMSENDCQEMVAAVDIDGDGQVNYEEFVTLFSQINPQ